MKVTLDFEQHFCEATVEPSDKKMKNGGWGSAESQLLHHVKKELIKQGFDVIKKRMWKDGHMMGNDSTQYVRTRSTKEGFMIYDGNYAIRDSAEEFNTSGRVKFNLDRY